MKRLSAIALFMGLAWAASAAETGSYAAEITASQLRLRAGPGQAYQEVLRLDKGARVIVLGKHANSTDWQRVEVPSGYGAWIKAEYIEKKGDGTGTITTERLLIRPRPSTRYHQLAGRLNKGEVVAILGEKKKDDGLWMRVQIPRRVPLYAHGDFLKKIGAPSLAEPRPEEEAAAKKAATRKAAQSKELHALAIRVDKAVAQGAGAKVDPAPMGRSLQQIDRTSLTTEDRATYYRVQANIASLEKRKAEQDLLATEHRLKSELDEKLKEIDREYQKKLAEIEDEAKSPKRRRYTATGIVKYAPDVFGKFPSHRLVVAGKIRNYLISTTYDLSKFAGKRVGVIGLTDPESGTGLYTIMVKRIEILGDE